MISSVTTELSRDASDQPQLLAGLRRRDPRAYQELVEVYGPRMLAVARRILRCETDAADAVQEAYLAAIKSLDRFQGRAALGTWLHRIVVNVCLMQLRHRARRPATSLDELLPRFADDGHHLRPVHDWTVDAPSRLSREETRTQVRNCVDRLPPDYRTVIMLRDLEGLDTKETARMLRVSRSVVKTRLHRARQALRELLGRNFDRQTEARSLSC